MPNKTKIFSDQNLSELTALFNEIQKTDAAPGLKLKDMAGMNFVNNGSELKRMEDFNTECWTLAVLMKINSLGYEIKKKE